MLWLDRLLSSRDLVIALVQRDLMVRYRRSSIGFLSTMLQPLLTMMVLQVAFSSLFRFNVANYPVYVLSGVLFWNFLQQSVVTSMTSLRTNARLLKKVPVPKEVFPIASVLSGVVNLLLAMGPLLVILIVTGHPLRLALLFLPVSIVIATTFVLGAGLLLAPLAAFFHDVIEMVGVALMMLMFLTPVIFPLAIVPERHAWIVRINPICPILEVFRAPIFDGKLPSAATLLLAGGIALVMLGIGWAFFRRSSDRIAFYL
ncbi:MAG: ABC transporter permease [Acidobacteriota bacterium]